MLVMANVFLLRRSRCGMLLPFVALAHLAILYALGRQTPGRPEPKDRVLWVEARRIVASAPAVAGVVTRAAGRQRVVRSRASAAPEVSGASGADQALSSVPVMPAAPSAPSAPSAPLDLSPERLGSLLGKARHGDTRGVPPQAWRATAPDEFAPVRQSETVGASGSRVTRVDGPLGTYCIRSPQPGRPQPSGAGPELALPTNCP